MKTVLVLAVTLASAVSANGQNVLTGKEIYRINRDAVVQIYAGNEFGDGFIVSADGVIVTANHVVTTRESRFRRYASDIKVIVFLNGGARPYPATPVEPQISDDQVNFDYARLKITASGLPHAKIGNWAESDIGDQITVISSLPSTGTILLQGSVSSKGPFGIDIGPKLVNTILFQCPIRNGFSGSPIFSSSGHVIGIEDTKVFGISPNLDSLRTKLKGMSNGVSIVTGGSTVSLPDSFVELIDNLDQNLISGLGSGVDISYAKREQQSASSK